jgi:hypothetical protein
MLSIVLERGGGSKGCRATRAILAGLEWQHIVGELSEVGIEQDGRRVLLRNAPVPTIDPRHPSSRRSRRRRNPADLWGLKLTMR